MRFILAGRSTTTTLSVLLILSLVLSAQTIAAPRLPATATQPPTPAASPKVPWTNLQYGFTMALLGNNSQVRSMGFHWVSYTLGWDSAEPIQGQYNWGDADNIVNAARTANVNVMIRVSRTPRWARDPACDPGNPNFDTCPPTDPRQFGDFMGALAAHVAPMRGTSTVAYEIWNEPNTDNEWGGLCPDPVKYSSMVRTSYPRIKSNDPQALVVAGAVTTVGRTPNVTCAMDDIDFLRGMYNTGLAPYFDVLSDHPYGFAYAPEVDPVSGGARLVFRRAERHRDIMIEFGDANKQMWATEMGWALDPATVGLPNCGRPDWFYIFNPQQQADYLVRAYQWARSYWPWMGVMFTFNFDFSEAPWYDQCHPFRFWSVKGRPAQAALAALAQNPPPTYTPAVDSAPTVRSVRYSALSFGRSGGTLTVDLDAVDDDNTPVDVVQALLTYPDGGTQLFTFSLVSGTNRDGTWRTAIAIPANAGGSTQTYSVAPFVIESAPPRRTTNAPTQQISVTATHFWDVPADFWAYTFIEYLAGHGIISGYSDNSFRPGSNATRGQFSKMVVLAEGWSIDLTGAPHFTDVDPSNVFYPFIETAVNHGVISGYSDHTFRWGNNITRGQIAKIIVLAQGWPLQNPPTPRFTDVPTNSPFYVFIETAVAHGIVSGYSDNTFRPATNATRAQLSKMLYLALGGGAPGDTPTSTDTPLPTETPTPGLKDPSRIP